MLDELLISASNVAKTILPIVGAIALIYLCVMLKHTWKLIDNISDKVTKLDPSIKKVEESLEKVQAPLDTVVKASKGLDNAAEKSKEYVNKAGEAVAANADKMMTFVQDKVTEVQESDTFKNPFKKKDESDEAPADVNVTATEEEAPENE